MLDKIFNAVCKGLIDTIALDCLTKCGYPSVNFILFRGNLFIVSRMNIKRHAVTVEFGKKRLCHGKNIILSQPAAVIFNA